MKKTSYTRGGMSPADRAKQFMPFAALKGYEEALRKKEAEMEAKAEKKNDPFDDDLSAESSDIPLD